jgi:hypothetical protein
MEQTTPLPLLLTEQMKKIRIASIRRGSGSPAYAEEREEITRP